MDKEKFCKVLGEVIKDCRESKNITLKDISDVTGIRKDYLEKIEKGKAPGIKFSHLFAISYALRVRPEKIFEFVEQWLS